MPLSSATSIKLPRDIHQKLRAVSRVLITLGYPSDLYIEGSYAIRKANPRSDIDISIVVPKKMYNVFRKKFGSSIRNLKGVVRVFDFGESRGYPNYHYCYVIFKRLGPYKVFDICITPNGQKVYRGKRVLFFSTPKKIVKPKLERRSR